MATCFYLFLHVFKKKLFLFLFPLFLFVITSESCHPYLSPSHFISLPHHLSHFTHLSLFSSHLISSYGPCLYPFTFLSSFLQFLSSIPLSFSLSHFYLLLLPVSAIFHMSVSPSLSFYLLSLPLFNSYLLSLYLYLYLSLCHILPFIYNFYPSL